MLSPARRQQRKLNQQKKMQSESSVFLLDIKLLFAKAEKGIATGFRKIQALHKVLSDKIVTCLDKMSVRRTLQLHSMMSGSTLQPVNHTFRSRYTEWCLQSFQYQLIPVARQDCSHLVKNQTRNHNNQKQTTTKTQVR